MGPAELALIQGQGEWPPPDWPACPDGGRYRAALQAYDRMMANYQAFMDESPPCLADDAMVVMGMVACTWECTKYPQAVCPGPESDLVHLSTTKFIRALSEQIFASHIGLIILTENGLDETRAEFAVLSRDPEWMGLPPILPKLRGMEVTITCYPQGEPMVITAMLPEHMDPYVRTVLQNSRMPEEQRNEANWVLEQVLRYHGAKPYFMRTSSAGEIAALLDAE